MYKLMPRNSVAYWQNNGHGPRPGIWCFGELHRFIPHHPRPPGLRHCESIFVSMCFLLSYIVAFLGGHPKNDYSQFKL